MFDPRLLEREYPMNGLAWVQTGRQIGHLSGIRTGSRAEGKWVYGTAVGVYSIGKTPFFVVFVLGDGTEYMIEHSEQLKNSN